MSASRRSRWRGRSIRFGVVAIVTAIAVVTSGVAAVADDSSSTSSLPPAPAGFTNQVVGVYQSEYAAAQTLGKADALQSVAQYQQQLAELSPDQLNVLYAATQENPQWNQIPTLMQTVAAEVAGTPSVKLSSATTAPGAHQAQLMSAVTPDPSVAPQTAMLMDSPVGAFTPAHCDDGPPAGAIFAMLIVIDVAQGVYNVVISFLGIGPNTGLGAAAVVAAAVILAAAIVHDTLEYVKGLSEDCESNNQAGFVANIDNTTSQTYNLAASIATTVTNLEKTSDDTVTAVHNVQTSLVTIQQSLEQTLASDTQTLQTALGSSSQNVASSLQTVQTAIQTDITTIQAAENTNKQAMIAEVDKGVTSVQSTLSASLQQALHETDTTAQGLTALVTQGNQQIMNTLQSNFTTGQSEYNNDLKLDIEHALGSGQAVVQMKLPAASGGYLNSTPVGVMQVVNDDLHALQALKVTIQPNIVATVNAGNSAVAAGQWLTAFANFMKAYQSFAGA